MESLTQEQQSLPLWKSFFILTGIISLIFWNSVLNLTLYFDQNIEAGFFVYITFSFCLGNIISFFLLRVIFTFSTKKQLFLFGCGSCISFSLLAICMELVESVLAKKIISISLIFVNGFMTGCFQGCFSGFSSACGPISISSMNIGTGCAGFGSNIISIIFVYVFPTDLDPKGSMKKQLWSYVAFLNILFLLYLIIFYTYNKKHGHFFDDFDIPDDVRQDMISGGEILDEDSDEEDLPTDDVTTPKTRTLKSKRLSSKISGKYSRATSKKSYTTWKTLNSEPSYPALSTLKRIIDLWVGITFTYYFTLEVVCFFAADLTKKYDENKNGYLLFYFFSYNLGDTLGKLTPNRFNVKNSFMLHATTLFRVLLQFYFIWITFTTPSEIFYHYLLRGLIFFIIGSSNGYLTNVYFCHGAERFRNPKNKDNAGFFIIFGLVLGVSLGSFSGVLWSI